MKKHIHNTILWLIIIIIPIIALAEKPPETQCPAVDKTLHHDIDSGTSAFIVTRYDSSAHYKVEIPYVYCKQCRWEDRKPIDRPPESHQKGYELETLIKRKSKDGTKHSRTQIRRWACSSQNYGCGHEIEESKALSDENHFCSTHSQLIGTLYIHRCACGHTKITSLNNHF